MNYHSDEWIMDRVQEHYQEALDYFPADRIVCLVLQGSQNYGLDTGRSDVDTKLILTPTLKDIAMNRQPISTTHVRANNEHTDWKDIRLMLQTFRKCNLNFLEILFSPYCIVNPIYAKEWSRLIQNNEMIANYDPCKAVKTMCGLARRKYEQMEHESPSHHDDIAKYGYSPKELHHLLRIEEYIDRYISGESYARCLRSNKAAHLCSIKLEPLHLDLARAIAGEAMKNVEKMCDKFIANNNTSENKNVDILLDDVQYNIMKIAIERELK